MRPNQPMKMCAVLFVIQASVSPSAPDSADPELTPENPTTQQPWLLPSGG